MQERENQTGSSAEEPRVRVMSEDEARDYQGVTIEEHKDGSGQRVRTAMGAPMVCMVAASASTRSARRTR